MSAVVLEGFSVARTWGLDVVNDFFVAGASFGAFMCASLYLVFGVHSFRRISLFATCIALVCLLMIPFNLIDDLKQPARVYEFFLNGWANLATSPMKWGVILLMVYPLCLLALIFCQLKNLPAKKLAIFTLFLSACVPGYTGYILGASVGVSFWNTPVLPLLFIANGAIGGVGLLALCALVYSKIQKIFVDLEPLIKLCSFLIIADLLLRFFWFSFMLGFNKELTELYHYAFTARFYEIFILEFILIAFILLSLFTRLKNFALARFFAFCCMVIYSFSFKFNVVFAGQSMPKIMGGFLDFSPSLWGQDSLSSVFANWCIGICIFCIIASILPLFKNDFAHKGIENE